MITAEEVPTMARFEELDWCSTPMGEISLRRRLEPTLKVDVYEVRLGDEYLMSSLFTVAEIELARLGLAAVRSDDSGVADSGLDVVVGGLGLGYTARAALSDPRVRSLSVVEALPAVISWHERGLLPYAGELVADPRSHLVHGDFFAEVAGEARPRLDLPARWHAALVDIDHTPSHLLAAGHAGFYTAAGLSRLAARLHPGGVFALWSDAPPDDGFTAVLDEVFGNYRAQVVPFANHLTGGESANTVYTAVRRTAVSNPVVQSNAVRNTEPL